MVDSERRQSVQQMIEKLEKSSQYSEIVDLKKLANLIHENLKNLLFGTEDMEDVLDEFSVQKIEEYLRENRSKN